MTEQEYGMRLCIKARIPETDTAYEEAERFGLEARVHRKEKRGETQRAELCITNRAQTPFCGVIRAELWVQTSSPRFFLPAFLYGLNRGDVPRYTGQNGISPLFPRLSLTERGLPYAREWMVRADRLSHPAAILWDGKCAYGISAPPLRPDGFNGFFCRMGESESAVGFTLGYENAPALYVECRTVAPANVGCVTVEAGQTLCVPLTLYRVPGADERCINRIVRGVYEAFHQPPRSGASLQKAVRDIANAIREDAYVPSICNYSTRVFLENGEARQEPLASISWTGGVEVAVPLLRAALRLGDGGMRAQALSVVDHIVNNSMNPASGLPFDAWENGQWTTCGWWDGCLSQSGHSAYLIGQALYYILTAYELEYRAGVEHSDWLTFVCGCLHRVLPTQNEQGEFPYLWSSRTGEALEYGSFAGCWCAAAAAYCGRICKDGRFLAAAQRAAHHYHNAYVRRMECFGTPVDTYKAPDSEGILAFVKLCRRLHEATGQEEFLRMLGDGMEYEFTFKFCWNPPIGAQPLKRLGWSACGGSVTSVCNPHIHPMSNAVCDELAYCARATGDDYYAARLQDTVLWALQTYSTHDGEYDFGKTGWMSERFCYSEGLLTERYEDGSLCSTWRCFLPWGAANILEGLCGTIWDRALA